MRRIDAVIFDLDGTLADTLRDLMEAMNHVLLARGLPCHDAASYKVFIGEGVMRLVERASGLRDAQAVQLKDAFLARYAGEMLRHSAPYPGIVALLLALQARELPLAVLSNKPHDATCHMVEKLFARDTFGVVLGQREGTPRKPDPAAAREIAHALSVAPQRCAFVGDTAVDMQTASAAEMLPVGVSWGFRAAEDLRQAGAAHVIDTPEQLLPLL